MALSMVGATQANPFSTACDAVGAEGNVASLTRIHSFTLYKDEYNI